MVWQLVNGEEMMICQLQEMVKHGAASSIMRTGRVYAIKRTKEDLRQKQKQRSGSVTSGNSREKIWILTLRILLKSISLMWRIGLSSFEKDSLEVFEPILYLKNGDDLSEYGIVAKVVELPGHTKGSIGIEIEDNLFVGDALMNMFYPTVSMLYVDEQEMISSAKYISELGEKTICFGHGKTKRNRKWVK